MVLCLPIFWHLNLNPGTLILGAYHWWLSWHCVDRENLTPCSDIQWTLLPAPGKTWSMSKCSTWEPVFCNYHRKMHRWYQITRDLRAQIFALALQTSLTLSIMPSALDPWSDHDACICDAFICDTCICDTCIYVMHVSMKWHFCYERTDKVWSIFLRKSCAITFTSTIPHGGFCFLIVQ